MYWISARDDTDDQYFFVFGIQVYTVVNNVFNLNLHLVIFYALPSTTNSLLIASQRLSNDHRFTAIAVFFYGFLS